MFIKLHSAPAFERCITDPFNPPLRLLTLPNFMGHRLSSNSEGHRLPCNFMGHPFSSNSMGHPLSIDFEGHRLSCCSEGHRLSYKFEGHRLSWLTWQEIIWIWYLNLVDVFLSLADMTGNYLNSVFEFGRCLPLFSWHDRKFIWMNENFGELEILSYKWIIRWTRVKVS